MGLSMKDIARAAEVSVATVSNTLSGRKYVSPQLRERVEEAIKQLQYRPSKIARSLKTKKTFQIGLMVPDITNPYFAEIARGVESIALQNGYQLFLCNTDGHYSREEKTIHSFLDQRADGIINVAPRMSDEQLCSYARQVSTVILDREILQMPQGVDLVFTNNYDGPNELARYLIKLGHHHFACITGPDEVPSNRKRVKGFESGLFTDGIPRSRLLLVHGDFSFESGFRGMEEVFEQSPRPTALFCCNDLMAWGALESAKQKGMKIPEDIAIAGFDNVYFSEFIVPTLTTIHQPKFEAGQIAMKTLLDRFDAKQDQPKKIELPTQLVIRKST